MTLTLIAIEKDELYAFGWNEHGNLGTGDLTNRCFPVLVDTRALLQVAAGGASSFICSIQISSMSLDRQAPITVDTSTAFELSQFHIAHHYEVC